MSNEFKPSEVAPEAGVYRVSHYAHRLPHNVIVLEGDIFPVCKTCGTNVVFREVATGTRAVDDRDFQIDPLSATSGMK